MPAYFVGEIDVTDTDLYETYKPMAREAVLAHGGAYLAAGGETTVIEGAPPANRVVVLRFPSFEAVMGWFRSDDYAEALDLRRRSTNSRTYAVEGLDVPPLADGEAAAYYIGERDVHDEEAYKTYMPMAGPTIAQYGGAYLVRGGRVEALEGDPPMPRIIMTRWPDVATCRTWFGSPEYTPAYAIRKAAATCRTFVVDGLA
ncbi:MAG: DUF1330 domain-containing protein [Rhodospirillales bacterium]